MNCRGVQNKLMDALAAKSPVTADVLAHQESCQACRDFLGARLELFASLDAGLTTIANRPVPPSLFPRVRDRIEVAKSRRSWLVRWAPAGVALVLACAVALSLTHRGYQRTDVNIARSVGQKGNEAVTQGQMEAMVAAKPSTAPDVAHAVGTKRSVSRTTSIRTRMEVIFDKEEARGLNHLVRSIDQKPALAQGFLRAAPLPPDETKPAAPIEIAELNVAPLTDESR